MNGIEPNSIDPLMAQTLTSKVEFGIKHVSNMQIF